MTRKSQGKTYQGRVCKRCGGTERYLGRERACATCSRIWANKRRAVKPDAVLYNNYIQHGFTPDAASKAVALRPCITNCACCGSADPRHKHGWLADHDHLTGEFRGFVCHPCNIALGMMELHDIHPDTLRDYLKKNDGALVSQDPAAYCAYLATD